MPSCSLDGFSAIGKVHQSPSAKNVPPARFLNADLRVQHSPFGLLNDKTDSPLDCPFCHVKVEQKRYFFLKFHIDVNLWKITVRKSSLSDFNGRRCPTAVQYRILRTVNPQEQMEAVSRNRKPVWPVSFRFILLNIDIYRTVLVLFKGYSVTDGITVDRIRNEEIIANPLDYVKQFICAQNI